MPGGDGTGPFGVLRNCRPINSGGNQVLQSGYYPGFGRRFFGGGRGRGFRWNYPETGNMAQIEQRQGIKPAEELVESGKPKAEGINEEVNQLEKELELIKRRITELKKEMK